MRALVVTSNPGAEVTETESPASALNDLGCEVVTVGYDIDQLPEDIELTRPSVVVVDAGAHLEVGRAALRRAAAEAAAPGVPAAQVPGRAARPRVHARAAPVARLGLPLRRRHAH